MQRKYLRLLLGAVIAGVSLIVAGAAGSAPAKKAAGTVVFGAEQEPPCLNGALEGCNNTWTSWTSYNLSLGSGYIVYPDFSLRPYMFAGEAKITKKPFTVTATMRKNAKWS